ncbi:MAG TPA: hypothetical protein VHI76_04155 [Solirubrobacterales bacterium]|jgi:hypothetical protein|nr:hypothetical protein [Solirubrobacterales bacterium]
MQGGDGFQTFAKTGLERLGIEVDDVELAVIEAADSLYHPHLDALLAADVDDVEPEPEIDLSEPPR